MQTIETAKVNRGRLLALKLKHNRVCRERSIATIRPLPNGTWQARIGGFVRGHTCVYPSQVLAEKAVNAHYNETLMKFLGKDH